MSLGKRLDKLEAACGRQQGDSAPQFWDIFCGAAPAPANLGRLSPRDRELLEAALRVAAEPIVDRVEERLREALAHAEADDAANRANLHKCNDAIAKAEKAKLEAEAAKVQAEVDAIRMKAEAERAQAMAEATSRLIEATSKLQQQGGKVIVDPEQLRQLLRLPPPE
jgi:hypothetical protein